MFVLTLARDPKEPIQIQGSFTIGEGGVLTVHEEGVVPRIYAPAAWIQIEDFGEE